MTIELLGQVFSHGSLFIRICINTLMIWNDSIRHGASWVRKWVNMTERYIINLSLAFERKNYLISLYLFWYLFIVSYILSYLRCLIKYQGMGMTRPCRQRPITWLSHRSKYDYVRPFKLDKLSKLPKHDSPELLSILGQTVLKLGLIGCGPRLSSYILTRPICKINKFLWYIFVLFLSLNLLRV